MICHSVAHASDKIDLRDSTTGRANIAFCLFSLQQPDVHFEVGLTIENEILAIYLNISDVAAILTAL